MNDMCIDKAILSAACLMARSTLLGKAHRESDVTDMLFDTYAAYCTSQYAVCLNGPHLERLSEAFAHTHPEADVEGITSLLSDFLSCVALEQARHDIGSRLREAYHDPGFIASAIQATGTVVQDMNKRRR